MAGFLRRMLDPVIEALRFESVPRIELRPTGRWRGWSDPAGHVCVSNLAPLWRPAEFVDVVVYEWAHSLTQRIPGAFVGHDAAFLCIN